MTGPAAAAGRPLPRSDAWALTRAISPRALVRVADVDAYGQVVNTYTRRARVDGVCPDAPWAVYLADDAGLFHLLAFDFDAGKGDPGADSAVLCGWLEQAGLPHVLTRSGPGGGRHVWLALANGVGAGTVDTLARLVRARLPSLDIAPLTNPVTGCVRPPGAPHRRGGTSTALAGAPAMLSAGSVTAADVARLLDTLSAGFRLELPAPVDRAAPLPVDGAGRLYLPGLRRELPAGSAEALQTDAAAADANRVLRRVLVGAVSARWRCADVAPLVASCPGLEHVRSQGQGPGRPRRLRGAVESRRMLARQWDRAVRWVASHTRAAADDDPTFEPRAAVLAGVVEQVQARADATPGRWAGPGGPADRRVLDALCVLSLQGMCRAVEADIRRLGLSCGIGRETARTALLRLARDGWVARDSPAEGPRGASWILISRLSTAPYVPSRSQADPRPLGAGAAQRTRWIALLRARLSAAAHDVFTYAGGLGHVTGQLYAALTNEPASITQLARQLGITVDDVGTRLGALRAARLARRSAADWALCGVDWRDAAARRLGVSGRLVDRAQRYRLERQVWAWWSAELAWMRSRRRTAPARRPGPGQFAVLCSAGSDPTWQPHPRQSGGRADYRLARQTLLEGDDCGSLPQPAFPARAA